ncbi:MAG: SHOCT domain-containing protein [Chloroflexota bacterium]
MSDLGPFGPFGINIWFFLGLIANILFWGAIILLIYFLIKNLTGREGSNRFSPPPEGSRQTRHETPEEVARRRLAAGEISEEEYDRIMAKLRE